MARHCILCWSLGAAFILAASGAASAQPTAEQLKLEIASLQQAIDPLVAPRVDQPSHIRVDLSAAPVSRLFAYVDSLPAAQKQVSFNMSSAAGGIAHWEGDCNLGPINVGSIGAWAFFEDVNGGGIWLNLGHTAAAWNAAQHALALHVDVSAHAFVPTIHTQIKPVCFLPRIPGPNIGPIAVDVAAQSNTQIKVDKGASQLFSVDAPVNLDAQIEACTRIIFFDVCIPFNFSKQFEWKGEVGGPLVETGSITVPVGGTPVMKQFELDLSNRTVTTTSTGYRVVVAPVITWR
jgi:hypothetical protein